MCSPLLKALRSRGPKYSFQVVKLQSQIKMVFTRWAKWLSENIASKSKPRMFASTRQPSKSLWALPNFPRSHHPFTKFVALWHSRQKELFIIGKSLSIKLHRLSIKKSKLTLKLDNIAFISDLENISSALSSATTKRPKGFSKFHRFSFFFFSSFPNCHMKFRSQINPMNSE